MLSDNVGYAQSHEHFCGAGHPQELSKRQEKMVKNKKKNKKSVPKKVVEERPNTTFT